MTKLFGFFKARGGQPARLVRVDSTGQLSREELRRRLAEISARKSRARLAAQAAAEAAGDEQPSTPALAPKARRPAAVA